MQASAVIDVPLSARIEARQGALPIRFERVGFAAGDVRILESIDLELGGPGPTIVMGPNGSGKTTLLKLGMGLVTPTTGRITFAGDAAAAPGSRAMVLQKPVML